METSQELTKPILTSAVSRAKANKSAVVWKNQITPVCTGEWVAEL